MKAMPWVNMLLGLWLIVSPFLFGYTNDAAAFWNSEVIGFMLVVITGVVAVAIPRNARNHTKGRSSA
jgi:hypothetical protein